MRNIQPDFSPTIFLCFLKKAELILPREKFKRGAMKKFLAINAVALPVIAALIVGGAYSGVFFALGRFFELFGVS